MLRLGCAPAFNITVVAAAGTAVVIPPSIVAIHYGWQANTSVGALLAAGFAPSKEPLDRVIRSPVPLLLVMAAMLAAVAFVPEMRPIVARWLYGK